MIGCNACPAFGFAKGEPAGGAGFFQTLFFQNVLFLTVFFFLNCIFSNCICPTCIFPNCFFLLQTIFFKTVFVFKTAFGFAKGEAAGAGSNSNIGNFPTPSTFFGFQAIPSFFYVSGFQTCFPYFSISSILRRLRQMLHLWDWKSWDG